MMKRSREDESPDKGASGTPDFVSEPDIMATISAQQEIPVRKSHAVFYKFSIDRGLQFLIAHCYQGYKFNNTDRRLKSYSDLLSPEMIHRYNDYFKIIESENDNLTKDEMVIRKMGNSYIFTSPRNTFVNLIGGSCRDTIRNETNLECLSREIWEELFFKKDEYRGYLENIMENIDTNIYTDAENYRQMYFINYDKLNAETKDVINNVIARVIKPNAILNFNYTGFKFMKNEVDNFEWVPCNYFIDLVINDENNYLAKFKNTNFVEYILFLLDNMVKNEDDVRCEIYDENEKKINLIGRLEIEQKVIKINNEKIKMVYDNIKAQTNFIKQVRSGSDANKNDRITKAEIIIRQCQEEIDRITEIRNHQVQYKEDPLIQQLKKIEKDMRILHDNLALIQMCNESISYISEKIHPSSSPASSLAYNPASTSERPGKTQVVLSSKLKYLKYKKKYMDLKKKYNLITQKK